MGEAIIAYVIMCFAIIGVVVTLGFMSEYLMLLRIMRQLRKHLKADADVETGVEMGKVNRVEESSSFTEDGEWKGLPCPHDAAECYTVNGVDKYNCSDCGAPIEIPGSAETGGEKAADWYEVERHATNLENLSYVYAESFLLWQARVDAPLSSAAIAKFLDAHQRRVTELLATIGGV